MKGGSQVAGILLTQLVFLLFQLVIDRFTHAREPVIHPNGTFIPEQSAPPCSHPAGKLLPGNNGDIIRSMCRTASIDQHGRPLGHSRKLAPFFQSIQVIRGNGLPRFDFHWYDIRTLLQYLGLPAKGVACREICFEQRWSCPIGADR